MDVKHFGADGEAVESLCSEQESSEQVFFLMHLIFPAKTMILSKVTDYL